MVAIWNTLREGVVKSETMLNYLNEHMNHQGMYSYGQNTEKLNSCRWVVDSLDMVGRRFYYCPVGLLQTCNYLESNSGCLPLVHKREEPQFLCN